MKRDLSINISEVFFSTQGEGSTLGYPAIFIRLSGKCNVGCSYCDSKHAWVGKEKIYIEDLMDDISKYNCDRVVVTGTEPSIIRNFDKLIEILKNHEYIIEVETNGTKIVSPKVLNCVDKWNVSVKLASCGVKERKRIKPEAIKFFNSLSNVEFKFVISDQNDFDEMERLRFDYKIDKDKVRLMAQGAIRRELIKNMKKLIVLAKKGNYRITPRLQTFLWSNTRGK